MMMLALSWTGTFLHDIDELVFDHGLSHSHFGEAHHHGGHMHAAPVDGAAVVALPEMHGHDPSALSSIRNPQQSGQQSAGGGVVGYYSLHVLSTPLTWCYACQERPPPHRHKIPTYLLYRAMLI